MLETPGRIEPCYFEDAIPSVLADLAMELQNETNTLGRDLHPDVALELADLVRIANSYYSNSIEGHNARPEDIEKALAGAEIEPEHRALALEAKAHVIVQREIDNTYFAGRMPSPTSVEFITWVHRMFYDEMPAEFRIIERLDG